MFSLEERLLKEHSLPDFKIVFCLFTFLSQILNRLIFFWRSINQTKRFRWTKYLYCYTFGLIYFALVQHQLSCSERESGFFATSKFGLFRGRLFHSFFYNHKQFLCTIPVCVNKLAIIASNIFLSLLFGRGSKVVI